MPEVEPLWFQIPMQISNATSPTEQWLQCWKEGDEWIRPKEETSFKENLYGTHTFRELFGAIAKYYYKDQKTAFIGGVRTEESPQRMIGLTSFATYKHITYGIIMDRRINHYGFYPIYDWTYKDVWKAIHDNGWPYCKMYDYYYMYGVKIQQMRVSNLHHETAIRSLYMMQEIEPHNWGRLAKRLKGINTAKQGGGDLFAIPKTLPFMFRNWREYKDHLLETLVTDPKIKERFTKSFAAYEKIYCTGNLLVETSLFKQMVASIITNDYHMTKFTAWQTKPQLSQWKKWKYKGVISNNFRNDFISYELQGNK